MMYLLAGSALLALAGFGLAYGLVFWILLRALRWGLPG